MTTQSKDRAIASHALAALQARPSRFTLPNGTTVSIPRTTLDGLIELLSATAEGDDVTIVRSRREVTTQQAAKLLNVSRPTIVKLIDNGELPSRMVGSHRRIPLADLLQFRDKTVAQRRAALDAMTADAESLGLYD